MPVNATREADAAPTQQVAARIIPNGLEWQCPRCTYLNQVKVTYNRLLRRVRCHNKQCGLRLAFGLTFWRPKHRPEGVSRLSPFIFQPPILPATPHMMSQL